MENSKKTYSDYREVIGAIFTDLSGAYIPEGMTVDNFTTVCHSQLTGIGTRIRNAYDLWHNKELQADIVANGGPSHPEDMTSWLLEHVYHMMPKYPTDRAKEPVPTLERLMDEVLPKKKTTN